MAKHRLANAAQRTQAGSLAARQGRLFQPVPQPVAANDWLPLLPEVVSGKRCRRRPAAARVPQPLPDKAWPAPSTRLAGAPGTPARSLGSLADELGHLLECLVEAAEVVPGIDEEASLCCGRQLRHSGPDGAVELDAHDDQVRLTRTRPDPAER